MWLDQLESEAVYAQETEGSLAQQYQVSLCYWVYVWVWVWVCLCSRAHAAGGVVAFSHMCCLNCAQAFLL